MGLEFLKGLIGDSYRDDMTIEDIANELEKNDVKKNVISDNSDDVSKLKAALSKANGEAANYKRQLREKQTADEAAEDERRTAHENLVNENNELKRKIALSEKKSKLLGLGYAEELAEDTAKAMVDSDIDKVIENQRKFLEAQKQSITEELLKGTPRPKPGKEENQEMTREKFRKMNQKERLEWAKKNPDEYENMYSK